MTIKQLRTILEEFDDDTSEVLVTMSASGEEVTSVSLDAQVRDNDIEWELNLY